MAVSYTWILTTRELPVSGEPVTGAQLSGQVTERDLLLDPQTGDLELTANDWLMVAGVEAIASDLKSRLMAWLGEWELDITIGTDWVGKVLGKEGRKTGEAELRAKILETPGVTDFESFTFTITGRTLDVAFIVLTDVGAVISASLVVSQGAQ